MSLKLWKSGGIAVLSAVVCWSAVSATAQEESIEAKWYGSLGLGMLQYEGDEELEDGWLGTIRLGYDYSEWWSFEGAFAYAPKLEENFRNSYGERISRLEEATDEQISDTYAVTLAIDALFHFTRWDRVDPYLVLGGGCILYGERIAGETFDAAIRVGGGLMYHFNDEWAIRADGRTFLAGHDTEVNAIIDAGVVWTWGAGIAPKIEAFDGPLDSDGDGLSNAKEDELGTDPYNPDTDGDKLTDGEEVLDYGTNPLEPDTDWDGLKDGEEVHRYDTDPLDPDTDDGGVSDGHEVIDDNTDPRKGHAADDLQRFKLRINFDYDKDLVKPEYFREIEIVGKVLSRDPEATAVIEGHADRKQLSDEAYNLDLSERRAKAVRQHLIDKGGIEGARLKAKGFGFSRPLAPNDPSAGNPENRRVVVYVRKGTDADAADMGELQIVPAGTISAEDK
jgi:outer membrane protein OmpA-like peptidoglycan-associated protein/opacity protein-like surface antigen